MACAAAASQKTSLGGVICLCSYGLRRVLSAQPLHERIVGGLRVAYEQDQHYERKQPDESEQMGRRCLVRLLLPSYRATRTDSGC